uniref:Elongation of very long chain fatty acids protein n=1 Tax=Glossina morsitans morsitans TaxID=37546 RepID=A0A1B0G3G1_GLOMM
MVMEESLQRKYLYTLSWWYLGPLLVFYLTFVLKIGPSFMKNRPAYQLKTVLFLYNVAQIISCIYIIIKAWNFSQWNILNFKNCNLIYYTAERAPEYNDVTSTAWFVKNFELVETVLFVLRKKQNQVTALHIFHHIAVITLGYYCFHFLPVEAILFPMSLNCFVHIIMYFYYLMAAVLNAQIMRRFVFLKKSITIIQMIQFFILLVQTGVQLIFCHQTVTGTLVFVYAFSVVIIFYGFWDFYQKAYKETPRKAA